MDNFLHGKYSTTAMLLGIFLSLAIGAMYTNVLGDLKYKVTEPDWSSHAPVVAMNPITNNCEILQPINYTFNVAFRFERTSPDSTTVGLWSGDTKELYLFEMDEWLSINTIAHEVSHVVDTLMEENPTLHAHYEAYLQGAITECVHDLAKLAYSKTGAEI